MHIEKDCDGCGNWADGTTFWRTVGNTVYGYCYACCHNPEIVLPCGSHLVDLYKADKDAWSKTDDDAEKQKLSANVHTFALSSCKKCQAESYMTFDGGCRIVDGCTCKKEEDVNEAVKYRVGVIEKGINLKEKELASILRNSAHSMPVDIINDIRKRAKKLVELQDQGHFTKQIEYLITRLEQQKISIDQFVIDGERLWEENQ